ncbi:hypothetical protein CJP74_07575 [Psittacicella melopsittaci]|uniref:Cytochrome b561 bacterial/Ni-hydrogenase domain-containing protein n=1 Tax=Psittacicella melopsittaci TaxID=2028576 RepID=A0A3A1Y229_9GAMM|nr:cytochrome b/b6 domain-containing protein [Psittacicella melopsittaci]RIY31359.1 hypothetical protein CJP74_07575 [Psittacicella melopsittaci]
MQKYHRINIILHWLIFLLVVFVYYTGWYRALPLHRFAGGLVLVLAVIRLVTMHVWRRRFPDLSVNKWEKYAAMATKIALALLFIVVPILGIVFRMYFGLDLVYFGQVVVPAHLVSENHIIGESLRQWHVGLAYLALLLLAGHAGAAIYHHTVRKDNLLNRMF